MQNQMVRVTKEFTFDMAHALLNYDGPCKNIHGHTYKLQITLLGKPCQDTDSPKYGMVADFGWLKNIVKQHVTDQLDHALLLNECMAASLRACIYATTEKVLFVPFQPTCENILLYVKEKIQSALEQNHLQLWAIKLYETPTSWAEWYKTDQEQTV